MIHARKDYGRFQDPALNNPESYPDTHPISEDEPVMLFRAKDRLFPMVLENYRDLLLSCGLYGMAEIVQKHIDLSRDWQDDNGCKLPDVPGVPKYVSRSHDGEADG